jgi:L-asparaginase II
VESRHSVHLIVVDPAGGVVGAYGEVGGPMFPRSSMKPLQAVGMLRAGLDVDGPLLALACASHSGEPAHVAAARELLGRAGLDEGALGCPPDLPLAPAAAAELLRSGGRADPVHMNCSGKHAAMLLTCRRAGWPVAGYLAPTHPLQRALAGTVAELAGEPVPAVAVDGCGAPLFALSLTGLARAFTRLVTAPPGRPERRVADAMRGHPELVGGPGRDVTRLMRAVPGLLAKDGAEGVYAAATAAGAAVGLKVADGAARARLPVLVRALELLGVTGLDDLADVPVLGGGRPVGRVVVGPLRQ